MITVSFVDSNGVKHATNMEAKFDSLYCVNQWISARRFLEAVRHTLSAAFGTTWIGYNVRIESFDGDWIYKSFR